MIRLVTAIAAVIVASATAIAAPKNASTTANVPTGPDVPGCTHYRTLPGGKVEQVCNPNDIKELLKDLQSGTVGAYSSAFGAPGSGATGSE